MNFLQNYKYKKGVFSFFLFFVSRIGTIVFGVTGLVVTSSTFEVIQSVLMLRWATLLTIFTEPFTKESRNKTQMVFMLMLVNSEMISEVE